MNDFFISEEKCAQEFAIRMPYWHLCTSETNPIIFTGAQAYANAIALLALCVALFPRVKILTFQLMSNHIHIVLSGPEEDVVEFQTQYVKLLGNKVVTDYYEIPKSQILRPKLFKINDLANLRNAIAYVNRNALAVNPNSTPFNAQWGAGKYFYNDELCDFHRSGCKKLPFREKREMCHSNAFDKTGVYTVNGIASPVLFCDIESAQKMFRNARQYFGLVSRNMEALMGIANLIGEKYFYSDDDIYSYVCLLCRRTYKKEKVSALSVVEKSEIAHKLHSEFHAGNKQIARLLGEDIKIIDSMFPMSSK